MGSSWILDTRIDECQAPATPAGGCAGADGQAPVLVLGHSLGSSLVMWDDLIPLLTSTYRVVRFNLPGHGGSHPAPVGEPLTMDTLLDALERTLDALGVTQFHLAGLSIGGLITIAGAQRWGSGREPRLIAATAMASGPKNGSPDMWQERAALVRERGTGCLVDPTMERWFTPDYHAYSPAHVLRIATIFAACDDEGYAQCCEVLETTDLWESMDTISVPFAVVNGSEDAGFDDEAAERLSAAASSSPLRRVLHVGGTRHMCAMEEPALIADFLTAATQTRH